MAQVIIRNLDERAIQLVRQRAKRHGHSVEQELRDIITSATCSSIQEARHNIAEFKKSLIGRPHSDSTLLIREDRNR